MGISRIRQILVDTPNILNVSVDSLLVALSSPGLSPLPLRGRFLLAPQRLVSPSQTNTVDEQFGPDNEWPACLPSAIDKI
jgi:hypothetical protein|uniref:Uncharacterized protein n=1 Tax=Picea glauca TaxID=3330 RepID=A0A101M094_PICGL|nr:hypothetical protein ABT39_MTgene2657 [Picea glauca]KUM48582.1 hypothetical protein ABT39_MTgene4597 [Picea glauca]QHR92514.1 hypothetical protein Q903MT_gene6560 [Picea sitchensis]